MNRLLLSLVTVLLSVATVMAQDAKTASAPAASPAPGNLQQAYFAGGCFWCMQYAFDKVKGVKKTVVGYTGGQVANPSYEDVSSGTTGHAESIEVIYDPAEVTYPQLLDTFWHSIDPTAVNRQFADEGSQYRTEIWYRDAAEQQAAEASKVALGKSGKFDKPIATRVDKLGPFYPAEDYHQEYYQKNPFHFNAYEIGSGRAGFLKRKWGTEQPHS